MCSHIETEAKTALCGTKSHHSKNVMFFDNDRGDALQKACNYDYYTDGDTIHLVQAANIVRKEMFKQNIYLMRHLKKNH